MTSIIRKLSPLYRQNLRKRKLPYKTSDNKQMFKEPKPKPKPLKIQNPKFKFEGIKGIWRIIFFVGHEEKPKCMKKP